MKVKEICGLWHEGHAGSLGDLKYIAYYYAKIEDRYVILERWLKNNLEYRGPTLKHKLCDFIVSIYPYEDEKKLEEGIQSIIQYKSQDEPDVSRYFKDQLFFPPIEMQNGREIDLNLANIEVDRDSITDQASCEYVIEKKREELLLERSNQLQQTIKDIPERYSVEKYIEKYEQQSGTQLSEQQILGLKELDDKIQQGLIIGRYNLEDYSNFLNSIPDLLSGKKILGYGHFMSDGLFSNHGEINSIMPPAKKIASYNTYTYHTFRAQHRYEYTMDDFRVMPLSIKRRMDQDGLYATNKLCVIGMEDVNWGSNEPYDYGGILVVEPHDIRKARFFAYPELSINDISALLEKRSRQGLVTDAQEVLTGLATDKEPNERSEEQL